MKKLIKLTDNQISSLNKVITSTNGVRNKNVQFAHAIASIASRHSEPKIGDRIYRVYTYNYGTSHYPDRRDAIMYAGRFTGFRDGTFTTTYHKNGIFAGEFIAITQAAASQLTSLFSDYIY